MKCIFEKIDTDKKPWKCINCGYKSPVNAIRGCNKSESAAIQHIVTPGHPTSLGTKIKNFTKAAIKDVAGGMKRCTDEEMDDRLKICRGSEKEGIPQCPFYIKTSETNGSCTACGCVLSRDHVYLNKIAWKSESCPKGKW